jgi:hypothetical protein
MFPFLKMILQGEKEIEKIFQGEKEIDKSDYIKML